MAKEPQVSIQTVNEWEISIFDILATLSYDCL